MREHRRHPKERRQCATAQSWFKHQFPWNQKIKAYQTATPTELLVLPPCDSTPLQTACYSTNCARVRLTQSTLKTQHHASYNQIRHGMPTHNKRADGCNSCRVMLIDSFDFVPSAAAYLHEPAMMSLTLSVSSPRSRCQTAGLPVRRRGRQTTGLPLQPPAVPATGLPPPGLPDRWLACQTAAETVQPCSEPRHNASGQDRRRRHVAEQTTLMPCPPQCKPSSKRAPTSRPPCASHCRST